MDITHNRAFRGIWIPAEIWLENEINALEKILLVEINSLDNEMGCIAGNDYFAGFLGITTIRVSQMIKKLKNEGYIYEASFDGRVRTLKSNIKTIVKQSKDDYKAGLKEILRQNEQNAKSVLKEIINNSNTVSKSFSKSLKKDTASGFSSQSNYSEIPNSSVSANNAHTQKQKDKELKTKQEVEEFVSKFKAKEVIIDGILQTAPIFSENEIDLITEYILRRKKAYKSKVKNTQKALTGVLNDILQVMREIPLEIIFKQLDGVYVNCGTAGDGTIPWQTIKMDNRFKHLKPKSTFNNQNANTNTLRDALNQNKYEIRNFNPDNCF